MRSFILFIFFIVLPELLFSQLNPKTKWGNVSQSEIDYKQVPFDKEANAVILYEAGNMLVSYSDWGNKIHKRIKILTEAGKQEATYDLIYFSYFNTENIIDLKAQTINFENGKKEITPVKTQDIYDMPYYGFYRAKRFAFPNVKVGSIIELQYTLINDNHNYIENWEFQHHLPTLYSSLEIDVQVPIDYVPICTGAKLLEFIRKNKNKKDHKTKWFLTDIPSFEKQNFIYNESDQAERIDFQLKGYYSKSNKYITKVLKWTDINSMIIIDNEKKHNPTLLKTISKRISNDTSENLQIKKVLTYFSKNYKWDQYTQTWLESSLEELDNTKKGNSAELNFLLHNLLRSKGINSQLVLISLRDHRKLQLSYPYFNQFSTTINLITLRDGTSFLVDAVHLPDIGYEFMPLRNYNHYGLVLDSQNEKFISLEPPLSEFYSNQNYSLKDGSFLLIKTDKKNGYFNNDKTEIKNSLNLNMIEKSQSAPTLLEDKYIGTKSIYQSKSDLLPFYTIQNPIAHVIGQYRFDGSIRERALEFNFPFYYKVDVIVDIPQGYKVEISEDFNRKYELSSKELVYYQEAEIKEGKIIMHVELYMSKSIFANQYQEVKSFFEKSNLDAAKTILLKKI